MNYTLENGKLTVNLIERIDSANAEVVGLELEQICANNAHDVVDFDAIKLEYISSAGLRALLKIRKIEPTLTVKNVTAEVYEIFQMTGFSEIMNVEKAKRVMSVAGCPVIGRGAKGTVYRYSGDTIIKVYKDNDCIPDIERERELARKAFVMGVPTAIPFDMVNVTGSEEGAKDGVEEKLGSVFELIAAKSYSQIVAEDSSKSVEYGAKAGKLLHDMHAIDVAIDFPDARDIPRRWLKKNAHYLPEDKVQKLAGMIEELGGNNFLHCDYHSNNIMEQKGEQILIDMDTICKGNPVIDLTNTYFVYVGYERLDANNAKNFLGINHEDAAPFWDGFFEGYFGNPANKQEIVDKIELLTHLRILNHASKRMDLSVPANMDAVKKVANELCDLIDRYDSIAL